MGSRLRGNEVSRPPHPEGWLRYPACRSPCRRGR